MKLANLRTGLLLNFNFELLNEGTPGSTSDDELCVLCALCGFLRFACCNLGVFVLTTGGFPGIPITNG